jgi:L-alanine-DL-glutamate epimerase-like enolase superfamily enzyme
MGDERMSSVQSETPVQSEAPSSAIQHPDVIMGRLSFELLTLPLEFPFGISRSVTEVANTVLVRWAFEYQGHAYEALGEAVPTRYYGEDPNSVMDFYGRLQAEGLLDRVDPFNLQGFEASLSGFVRNRSARSALDMALHDAQGKILGMPLYRLWGLDPACCPKTSYTIGLADMEMVRHKTELAVSRGYDVLKVKLGGEKDIETLKLIKSIAPTATLRADANAAWTLDEARKILPLACELGIEFVEEPLKVKSPIEDYLKLKEASPLPLMADESCHTLRDIPFCAEAFHAVNLKPTKTGGLREAMRMIHAAKAHDLKVMLGCFTETSVANTAFGQLSPLVDYADLDGGLLLANDPFDGLKFEGSQIRLPNRPGIGVVVKQTLAGS